MAQNKSNKYDEAPLTETTEALLSDLQFNVPFMRELAVKQAVRAFEDAIEMKGLLLNDLSGSFHPKVKRQRQFVQEEIEVLQKLARGYRALLRPLKNGSAAKLSCAVTLTLPESVAEGGS